MADPTPSARMRARLRVLRDRLVIELHYLDARRIRRHFCYQCDRQTIRQHNHHAENLAAFRRIVGEEWRP